MGHWRDGGIGNMAGSDDRPIEEWTLLEKLACIAGGSGQAPIADTCQDAWDFIEPLTAAARRGEPLPMQWAWQPIETAPVKDWIKAPSYYRFGCLLQIPPGHPRNPPTVCAGYGYYVCAPRSKEKRILRWSDGQHQRNPKYWMPLPAAKED